MIPNREGIIVSPTEPAENRRKVWIQKGKNLFDKNNAIVIGKFLYEGGKIASDEDLFYQDNYIDVKANTEYVISATNAETFRILEYDKNKTYIRRDVNANANTSYNFTTSLNCCFIKISCSISNLENIQLEQGTTATEYEEYIEHKTYILNDNNVYEEFMKKEELYDSGWTTLNNAIKYRKKGDVVTVCGYSNNAIALTANDYKVVGQLPENFRPSNELSSNWSRIGEGEVGILKISTAGDITLYSKSAPSFWAFTITFIV